MKPCQCSPTCTALVESNHGSSRTYIRNRCRCESCVVAKRAIAKRYQERRKERIQMAEDFALNDDWLKRGTCRNMETNMFFPEEGTQITGEIRGKQLAAIEICRACPVMMQCRAYATKNREVGIWGGSTFTQRQKIRAGKLDIDDHDIDRQALR